MLLWISMDFFGYPCIDLLWILDPGAGEKRAASGLAAAEWIYSEEKNKWRLLTNAVPSH